MAHFSRRTAAILFVALVMWSATAYAQFPNLPESFNSADLEGLLGNGTSTGNPTTCLVRNCQTCVSGNNTRCDTCETGYRPNAQGLCALNCRVMNCDVCYASDNTKCATCAGRYKRNNNYLCVLPGPNSIVSGASMSASLLVAAAATVAAVVVATA